MATEPQAIEDQPWHGIVLADRYRLTEKLGEGGMGSVWRAEHLALKSPVAVKLMNPKTVEDDGAIARFMREAQASAALRSVNVVQILDYGVDEGTPFMVLELLEGEGLDQRLDHEGVLSHEELVSVMRDVGRAVTRAHELGIVHRDLKPANIFLAREGNHELAKVLDFGIAKTAGALGHTLSVAGTKSGTLLGTPYYMSPEQAQGDRGIDARSDLWALGVIAYECITGERPFQADTIGKVLLKICSHPIPVPSERFHVPEGFDEWFLRAVARDPNERFQSVGELVDALSDVLGVPRSNASVSTPSGRRKQPSIRDLRNSGALGQATTIDQFGFAESTTVVTRGAPRAKWGWGIFSATVGAVALAAWFVVPRAQLAMEVGHPVAGVAPPARNILAEPRTPPAAAVPHLAPTASASVALEPPVTAVPVVEPAPKRPKLLKKRPLPAADRQAKRPVSQGSKKAIDLGI